MGEEHNNRAEGPVEEPGRLDDEVDSWYVIFNWDDAHYTEVVLEVHPDGRLMIRCTDYRYVSETTGYVVTGYNNISAEPGNVEGTLLGVLGPLEERAGRTVESMEEGEPYIETREAMLRTARIADRVSGKAEAK